MPFILQVAVGRRPHLNVFGNDYDTADGTGELYLFVLFIELQNTESSVTVLFNKKNVTIITSKLFNRGFLQKKKKIIKLI